MNRAHKQHAAEPGQDSFLDIVANLVGILIILVMVVGVRAKDALLEAAPVSFSARPCTSTFRCAMGPGCRTTPRGNTGWWTLQVRVGSGG